MAGQANIRTAGSVTFALAATLILGSPSAGAAQSATAHTTAGGKGISLQPAHMSPIHPVPYFTFHRAAGTHLTDAVKVTNKSKVAVTLTVAAVDGLTGQTTGSVYANQGDPVRKAGGWVSAVPKSLHLGPLSSKTVPFTVTIPAGAEAGDHLAGIAFQSPPAATSTGGFQIKQIIRNVIGVLVVVPGPAVFHPELTHLKIKQIGLTGIASVVVTLGDDGLLLAKPSLRVALAGPNGYQATRSKALNTVLPGDIANFPFAWPDRLAKGSYDITAWLTGGGVTVVLRQTFYLGTKLAGTAQPPKPVTHSTNYWMWATAVLAALLFIGLVILLVMLARRRRRRRRPHGPSAAGDSGWPFSPTGLLTE